MIKKQKILIAVFAALFVLMLAAYFVFIRPLIATVGEDGTKLELLEGEVMISPSIENFYVFEPVPRASIQSIEVQNDYGGYKIYRDSTDTFQLEGCEGLSLDSNMFSSLVVSTGTVTAMERVATDVSSSELKKYGLDIPQASWTVTDISGATHTVYVGDMLITEGGFYIKLGGRNAVYIVSTTLAETVLAPASVLVSPLITAGMTQSDYYLVDEFSIFHDEELFLHIYRIPDSMKQNPSAPVEVIMLYPNHEADGEVSYYALNDTLYFEALYSLMALECEGVMELLPDEETSAIYGLDKPKYTIVYSFSDYDFCIFISELQADGYYYATSNLYGYAAICRISADSLTWLEKSSFDWIFRSSFYQNITTVSRITVSGDGLSADFRLTHGTDENGNNTVDVVEVNSGLEIPSSEARNFREFYKTLLNIANKEYSKLSAEDLAALVADESMHIMTLTYEDLNGNSTEYRFYKYYEASTGQLSSGKAITVIDGVGEFITSNDLVEKVLDSALRILDGLDVDPYGKN